jgi:hypothetical protein
VTTLAASSIRGHNHNFDSFAKALSDTIVQSLQTISINTVVVGQQQSHEFHSSLVTMLAVDGPAPAKPVSLTQWRVVNPSVLS